MSSKGQFISKTDYLTFNLSIVLYPNTAWNGKMKTPSTYIFHLNWFWWHKKNQRYYDYKFNIPEKDVSRLVTQKSHLPEKKDKNNYRNFQYDLNSNFMPKLKWLFSNASHQIMILLTPIVFSHINAKKKRNWI